MLFFKPNIEKLYKNGDLNGLIDALNCKDEEIVKKSLQAIVRIIEVADGRWSFPEKLSAVKLLSMVDLVGTRQLLRNRSKRGIDGDVQILLALYGELNDLIDLIVYFEKEKLQIFKDFLSKLREINPSWAINRFSKTDIIQLEDRIRFFINSSKIFTLLVFDEIGYLPDNNELKLLLFIEKEEYEKCIKLGGTATAVPLLYELMKSSNDYTKKRRLFNLLKEIQTSVADFSRFFLEELGEPQEFENIELLSDLIMINSSKKEKLIYILSKRFDNLLDITEDSKFLSQDSHRRNVKATLSDVQAIKISKTLYKLLSTLMENTDVLVDKANKIINNIITAIFKYEFYTHNLSGSSRDLSLFDIFGDYYGNIILELRSYNRYYEYEYDMDPVFGTRSISKRISSGHADIKSSKSAIIKICEISNQISTNILHLATSIADTKVFLYSNNTNSDMGYDKYAEVSYEEVRNIARYELNKRGNPVYDISAYKELVKNWIKPA